MDNYTQQLQEEMKNLTYVGVIEKPDYVFDYDKASCGDRAKVYMNVDKEGNITDMRYEQLGCGLNSIALEKIITYLLGKPFETIYEITPEMLYEQLEVPSSKQHCISLALSVLTKGLNKCDNSSHNR